MQGRHGEFEPDKVQYSTQKDQTLPSFPAMMALKVAKENSNGFFYLLPWAAQCPIDPNIRIHVPKYGL